ncbi:MAG: MFS transporter [Clostridia bacterium]|nr:MFS transporter [Clostridia bacterium]
MAYSYNIATSKKDNRANICLFSCHTILTIVDLFISTFLVAYIYQYCSSTSEYIFAVGQFYITNYAFNFIAIWLISYIVEKTNRVWMYRFSLVLELGVVLVAIFLGDKIAALAWLGGLMRGIFESFYYSSYNVLKQEMVSRKSMQNFAVLLQVISKVVSIVVPIVLGALISVSTYANIAIYIAIICVIQIAVSFGIKAHRPEGSKFRLTGYNKSLAHNQKAKHIMRYVYLGCLIYGCTTCIAILVNICVMFQYGSTLSLGAITSIISVVTMVVILLVSKFTHAGRRSWLFILSACLPLIGSICFVLLPGKVTLIVFNLCINIAAVIYGALFDPYRNGNLKELGLYSEITEHQALCEMLFCVSRVVTFGIIMILGLWGNMTAFYVALVVATCAGSAMLIYLLFYEKKYLQLTKESEEEQQKKSLEQIGETNENN